MLSPSSTALTPVGVPNAPSDKVDELKEQKAALADGGQMSVGADPVTPIMLICNWRSGAGVVATGRPFCVLAPRTSEAIVTMVKLKPG